MAVYRDEVAVLKSRDLREADKILTLFGKRQGKFAAIAKGVRKLSSRKRGHLETFSICKVACAEGKNLDLVIEADLVFAPDASKFDSDEFSRIGFAGMVMDKFLAENTREAEIYDSWVEFIQGERLSDETFIFVLNALDRLGFISPNQIEELSEYDSSQKRLQKLQRWVAKLLDTT